MEPKKDKIELESGKSCLYQWNTEQRIIVDYPVGTVFDFMQANSVLLEREAYAVGSRVVCNIPNAILQLSGTLYIYVQKILGGQLTTVLEKTYPVKAQPKPRNYINDEQEVLIWHSLEKRIKALEDGGGGGVSKTYVDQRDKETLETAKKYTDDHSSNGTVKSVNGTTPDPAGNVKIDIPKNLSDLSADTEHRTVTDAQIEKWDSSTGGGVSQTYVDQQDAEVLKYAKDYSDSKLVTIEIEDRGGQNFWTRPVTTANEIIDMVNAGKEVRLSFYDAITNTGDQLYPYENTRQGVCYFRRNVITANAVSRISWGVQYNGSIVATEIPYTPPLMTAYAVCHDPAAPPSSTANTWYIPKSMPKPSGNVGMMVDVHWENGLVNGLGYNASLIWGEPGGADNETIVSGASITDTLTGEHSIPTEGTVRYQLEETSGRMHWRYVSGDLIPTEFSTATDAATADKLVPGLALGYLPGMEIYVQMDAGNTADLMRLVPDEGATLPVYGNGTGAHTGEIPAGYILHLKNAGDHWQIINAPGGDKTAVLFTPQELSEEQKKTARENIGVTGEGGGGIDLGITGASVGQMAEVEEVDAFGKPKKWKPIPKPGNPTDEQVGAAVDQYLTDHPVQATPVDPTLTKAGEAADAKAAGDEITDINKARGKLANMVNDPLFTDIENKDNLTTRYADVKTSLDGILTIGRNGAGGIQVDIFGAAPQADHILFTSVDIRAISPTEQNVGASTVTLFNTLHTIRVYDGWQHLAETGKRSTNRVLRFSRDPACTEAGQFEFKNPVSVDLTEVFGAGNEPNLEDFDLFAIRNLKSDFSLEKYEMDRFSESATLNAKNICVKTDPMEYGPVWGPMGEEKIGNGSSEWITATPGLIKPGTAAGKRGDIMYWAAEVETFDTQCDKVSVSGYYLNDLTGQYRKNEIVNPEQGNHRLSIVYPFNSNSYPSIGCHYETAEIQNGKKAVFKNGLLINLTDTFGEGNEPSAEQLDAMLAQRYRKWFYGEDNIASAGAMGAAFRRYKQGPYGTEYGIKDRAFQVSTQPFPESPYWGLPQNAYGLDPKLTPMPSFYHGSIETDSMVTVRALYGRWAPSIGGKRTFGSHVMECWNNIDTFRLTLIMGGSAEPGDKREDEAMIFTYCPGVFDTPTGPLNDDQKANRIVPEKEDYYLGSNKNLLCGRVRIGSDEPNCGVLFRRKRTTFYGKVILSGNKYAPASATAPGEAGEICYDNNYLYICIADNTWKRVKLETW